MNIKMAFRHLWVRVLLCKGAFSRPHFPHFTVTLSAWAPSSQEIEMASLHLIPGAILSVCGLLTCSHGRRLAPPRRSSGFGDGAAVRKKQDRPRGEQSPGRAWVALELVSASFPMQNSSHSFPWAQKRFQEPSLPLASLCETQSCAHTHPSWRTLLSAAK